MVRGRGDIAAVEVKILTREEKLCSYPGYSFNLISSNFDDFFRLMWSGDPHLTMAAISGNCNNTTSKSY